MANRTLQRLSIEALEKYFTENRLDKEKLLVLLDELLPRRTSKARFLKARVEQTLLNLPRPETKMTASTARSEPPRAAPPLIPAATASPASEPPRFAASARSATEAKPAPASNISLSAANPSSSSTEPLREQLAAAAEATIGLSPSIPDVIAVTEEQRAEPEPLPASKARPWRELLSVSESISSRLSAIMEPIRPPGTPDYRPWYERRLRSVIAGIFVVGLTGFYIGGVFVRTENEPGKPIEASGYPPDYNPKAKSADSTPEPTKSSTSKTAQPMPNNTGGVQTSTVLSKKDQFAIDRTDSMPEDNVEIGRAAIAAAGLGINETVEWRNPKSGRFGYVTLTAQHPTQRNCYTARITRNDTGAALPEIKQVCF